MSTIAEKLTQLNTIKGDIKTAINNKGGSVGDDFSTYAGAINNLSTGEGGSGNIYMHPDYFELRTSNNTKYVYLFYDIYDFRELDLSGWDTSTVTDMSNMISLCSMTMSINVSGWDTSNVTKMNRMFYYNQNLTQIEGLSSFNTSKVTDMNYMFGNDQFLESLDLSGWDTSKVTNMNYMFYLCGELTTITGSLDLSNLTNGFYPTLYSNPIYNCKKLETLYLKNIYKNCTMTNASKWCINLGNTKIKSECLISIISELPDLINDKGLTATDKIILTLPKTNTLTAEQVQPAIDKGWTVANTQF